MRALTLQHDRRLNHEMNQAEFDNEKARAYWLGRLSEEEQARLEAVWFADEALYEQLQATQHDVFDAYVRGTLSPAERSSFEEQHGASPFVRERLHFASALAEHVNAKPSLATQATAAASWWQQAQAFFSFAAHGWQFNWQLGMAGAALVLLSVVGVWWLRQSALPSLPTNPEQAQVQPSPAASPTNLPVTSPTVTPVSTPAQLVAQQTPPPAPPTKPPRSFAVTLLPLAFRDGGNLMRLTLPTEAQSVQLVLQLPAVTPEQTFNVAIETSEERVVWRRAQLKPQLAQGQWQLRLTVPAALLEADDYVIKASPHAATGTESPSALYQLRVLRP